MSKFVISKLSIYPVKSTKGIDLNSMPLTKTGPEYDRRWMVIDDNGKFITQRKHAMMCLIETQLSENSLILRAPNMSELVLPLNTSYSQYALLHSEVWGTEVSGYDCGNEAAQWLSDFLGRTCRLITMPDSIERRVDPNFAKHGELVAYADGFPLLVVSQASLDDFNNKLDAPIAMERFRPNIVISGCEPYAEDSWQTLNVAGIELSLVKPCSRCIIPSIDPQTAEKQMQVNEALMQYRRRDRKTFFGQNAIHHGLGRLRVGDHVTIIS